ncbi:MAG: recombination regulator RecX [Treponema sp.]|nr:recombination regulator RecX [Treponema sp.]
MDSIAIVSVKSEANEDIRRIELSDSSVFSFNVHYLPPVCYDENIQGIESLFGASAISHNIVISSAQEEGFRFASACLRAEKNALQLIARAEQYCFGLRLKLEKKGHKPSCVRAVIDRLCSLGLLDDSRYAKLWLESRICRAVGGLQSVSSPWRLLTALASRGIDRDVIEPALRQALDEETELQLLKCFAEKLQKKQKPALSFKDPAACRLMRSRLKSEGFSSFSINSFFEEN